MRIFPKTFSMELALAEHLHFSPSAILLALLIPLVGWLVGCGVNSPSTMHPSFLHNSLL